MICVSYLRIKDTVSNTLPLLTKYRTHSHVTINVPNRDPEFNFLKKKKNNSQMQH